MSIPPRESTLLRDGVPDWDAIDFDVTCVRCGYNLKMLEQPRCPECGQEFEWLRVINYHHETSDFLFEHQWHKMPIRALLTTYRRTFSPRVFWSRVSLFERVRPGPLIFLIAIAVPIFLVVLHSFAWMLGKTIFLFTGPPLPAQMYSRPDPVIWLAIGLVDLGEAPFEMRMKEYLSFPGYVIGAILSALVLVTCLGDTLGRCRVRRVQVLRVFAYALLPAAIIQPLVMIGFDVAASLTRDWVPQFDSIPLAILVFCACIMILISAFGAYLSLGFKYYLRIPRPWVVGMTAAFVGILAASATFAAIGK